MLGVQAPSSVRDGLRSSRAPADVKTPSGSDIPVAKEASGQAYFKKLLQSKQFKETKKRASQRMAQEQAYKLADKVQQQMNEGNAGSAQKPTTEEVEEEASSSASDNDDGANNEDAKPAASSDPAPA